MAIEVENRRFRLIGAVTKFQFILIVSVVFAEVFGNVICDIFLGAIVSHIAPSI